MDQQGRCGRPQLLIRANALISGLPEFYAAAATVPSTIRSSSACSAPGTGYRRPCGVRREYRFPDMGFPGWEYRFRSPGASAPAGWTAAACSRRLKLSAVLHVESLAWG